MSKKGGRAKCDVAIPSKADPCILIESKGYGGTGSKQTDVIGDIEKIIAYQNNGDVTRICTYALAAQFEADLEQLKKASGL